MSTPGTELYGGRRARLAHEVEQSAFLQKYDQMRGIQSEGVLQRVKFRFVTSERSQRRAKLNQKGK
jgi:hypothetical protein